MRRGKERNTSVYAKMLGNIASDLDSLLSDLCIINKDHRCKENPSNSGTLHSADTLGKDSFFSSAGNTSKRLGDAVSTNHSLSDNDHIDCDSVDSGHEGRCRSGPSPLVFDPHHFSVQSHQASQQLVRGEDSQSMDEFRLITTLERVVKTISIWLLSSMSRAGAVHLLKDRDTGNFIVRKSSQSNSLALSVQSKLGAHPTVDHYLIESIDTGFRLHGSLHSFHSIPALIAYHIENIDEIPYHLKLPRAIQLARSTRELASLDLLGQDFWVTSLCRKSPEPSTDISQKSSSKPINIQRPMQPSSPASGKILPNTLPSRSASDFSMNNHSEMDRYFDKHIQSFKSDSGGHSAKVQSIDKNIQVGPSESQMDNSSVTDCHKFQESTHEASVSFGASLLVRSAQICQVASSKSHVKNLVSEEKSTSFSSPCFPVQLPAHQHSPSGERKPPHPKNLPFFKQASCSDVVTHSAPSPAEPDRAWDSLKTNLYSTTNLGLLEIPENSYFKSNLSDKLSDYEDVWRNSCCDSDAERQNRLKDPRTELEIKVNKSSSFIKESKKKVLRKTAKDSLPLSHNVSMNRDAVTGGTTGLTALERARQIARSDSEEDVRPVVKLDSSSSSAVSVLNTDTHLKQSTKVFTSVNYNQITSVNTLQDNVKKPPNLPQLGRLSRIKSSSESSLATASSPLYAEPVDAVKLRDKNGKAINIQVRRLSAPLSVNQMQDKQKKNSHKVSKHPQLDTILSPDAQTGPNPSQNKFSFESSVIKNQVVPLPANQLTRSYSMRTPHEMSQLQRKLSWKDRLNRLKLGTKVLTQNLTPPSAISARQKNLADSAQLDLDCGGQLAHDVAVSSPTLRKFPIENAQLHRASGFSESSTVQDLITCAHPELTICPIVRQNRSLDRQVCAPPSEYDNLQIYRASTHSSQGTVYSPPWESSTANRLIRDPPLITHALPPAMDINERIERWHQANSSYSGTSQVFQFGSSSTHKESHHQQSYCQESHHQRSHHQDGYQQQSQHQQSYHQQSQNQEGHLQQSQHQQSYHQQSQSQEGHLQQSQHQESHRAQQVQLLQNQHQVKVEYKNESSHEMKSSFSFSHSQQYHKERIKHLHMQNEHTEHGMTTLDSLGSPQLSNITSSTDQTFTSVNLADISSSAHTTSTPHRLSSHCPDVVNCHSSPIMLMSPEEDDVLFGGEMVYASEDLKQSLRPVLSPQTSMSQNGSKSPGTIIKEYIFKLSSDHKTIFGSTIENFIQCTLESLETNPQYVMRNVRQFMTGIKNYLVKHGEGELEDLIERERNKLSSTEILNIDAIIEQALHVCVLKPLKYHIYRLFVEKYSNNGALEQLSRNIKYARTKSAQDIGVKPSLKLPERDDMEVIKKYLDLMQTSYSPLQKLQNLLKATSRIYQCVQGKHHQVPSRGPSSLGADDFLPMLIYVIVHCGLVSAEIEADFMWGLLQPSLLTGEGGYYLTTLSSAVLILKNFQETHQLAPSQMEGKLPTISDMQGYLKIVIPDELHGSITWKTLPVRPNMNSRDVCSMVAHKFKVTNPQDYGLYLLCDGQESHLSDADCPQLIKGDHQAAGKNCYFAFKRLDATIAWPRHLKYTPSKQPG